MLRAAVCALLAATVAAEVITIRSAQANADGPGFSSETVYVLGSNEPAWSRASSFALMPPLEIGEPESGFSSRMYQLRPTSSILGPGLLLGSGLSEWVEGQLEVLSELQALLADEEGGASGGCGHMAPMSTQAPLPGMLGYLAASRFGPAFLAVLSQQGGEEGDAGDGYEADGLGAWAPEEEEPESAVAQVPGKAVLVEDPAGSDTYRWLEASGDLGETSGTWERASLEARPEANFLHSLQAARNARNAPSNTKIEMEAAQEGGGCVNWGLVLFCALLGATVAVWCSLFAAWRRLSAAAPRPAPQSAAWPLQAHLLAPLHAEKCTGPSAGHVEVAAEAVEHGTYHAPLPSGSEYVTIAYVPLKGEA